jgi:MshEN domain
MSSNPPSEGTFFVDQPAQPPETAPVPPAAPAPVAPAPVAQAAPEAPVQNESMRDVPLGTLIFRAGLLAEEQLEDALQEGMRSGKRLGEVLLERGWLQERDLGRLLAGQKGLPFVELSGVSPDPTAVPLIPEEKARMQNALAIAFEKGVPVVAVADPTNDLVMENLRRVLGCEPRLVVAAHGDLHRKIEESYAPVLAMPAAPEPVAPPPAAPATPAPHEAPPAPAEPVAATAPSEPEAVAPTPEPPALPPLEPALATPAPEPAPQPLTTPPVLEPAPAVELQQVEFVAEVPPIQAQPLVQPAAEEQRTPAFTPEGVVEAPSVVDDPPPLIQPLSVALPLAPEAAAPLAQPAPTAVPPAPEVPAPVVEQPVAQAAPEPQAPAPEVWVNGSAADVTNHFVVLRLSEGEQLEIGMFGSTEEAQGFAQEVVRQIATAEGEATWPFFAGRFLRPETIASVDVIAEAAERWMGSSDRARWASTNQ